MLTELMSHEATGGCVCEAEDKRVANVTHPDSKDDDHDGWTLVTSKHKH